MLDYSQLIQIRSQHFILSKVPNECTVGDFCSNKKLNDNRMIFVKHNPSKSDRSLKIRDAIVMDKVSIIFVHANHNQDVIRI